MAKGFAGALGAPQQTAAQGNPQQAMQQLTQMLHMVSGIHNEATYQAAKQQFAQAGGDPKTLSPHYKKLEVDNFKKVLIKGIQHLSGGAQQQPQGMQPPQAQPPQQSSAPAPQEC
jgi:hypothetical protein